MGHILLKYHNLVQLLCDWKIRAQNHTSNLIFSPELSIDVKQEPQVIDMTDESYQEFLSAKRILEELSEPYEWEVGRGTIVIE